jgi:hypothetical protein
MTYDWQTSLKASAYQAAKVVPPATLDETGWDILLALHRDSRRELTLQKLAAVASAREPVLLRWLASLEQRELVTGAAHPSTGELLATLTAKGRDLLDRYFSATCDLQVGAH